MASRGSTGARGSRPLAKLTRPRVYQAVPRERLFAALDRARSKPLVWVAAPPGAGKSTLLTSYLEARALSARWYQVDAGDFDPAALFRYLTDWLPLGTRMNAGLPQFTAQHESDLGAFARAFFRRLFSALACTDVLVFDNFQEAEHSPLPAILRHAANEIPDGMSVLVVSRGPPPAAFAELDARGAVARLHWDEVKLRLEETRAICAAAGISEDWVSRALHAQCDGWAAGVTLMLDRFKRGGSGAGELSGDTHEALFDYFATLVFDQGSGEARAVLMNLAFLPDVRVSLAHALTGDPQAARIVEALHRRHLFVDRRQGSDPVYQFHHLFRRFLRHKAALVLDAKKLRAHLEHMAAVLREQGEWQVALDLLMQAQAWRDALALLNGHAQELLNTARWQTLAQWIERFPQSLRDDQPWLDYWSGCARVHRDPVAAAIQFERAHARFARAGQRVGVALSLAGLLHACMLDLAQVGKAERWLDLLAQALREDELKLAPAQALSAWGALISAALFAHPWHPCIASGLERIQALLPAVGSHSESLRAASSALEVTSQLGHMAEGDRFARLVESLVPHAHNAPLDVACALFQLAHHRFLVADYQASAAAFAEVWRIAEDHVLTSVLTATLMARFMVEFRLGGLAAADAAMARIEALPAPQHEYGRGLLACYRARHAQLHGDRPRAAEQALQSQEMIGRTGAVFYEAMVGLINAEILLWAGHAEPASQLLNRARVIIDRGPQLASLRASLTLVDAWLASRQDRQSDSRRLLGEALRQARQGDGWCQMRFVDASASEMLPIALELGIEPDAARWLIRKFHLNAPAGASEAWPWKLRIATMRGFTALVNDAELEFGRKTPRKILGLLKALVALGPGEVADQVLVDALWPDEEGDSGHKALSMALFRLRRLLGDSDLIRQQAGKLSIDTSRCWVDAWAFEQRLADAERDPACTMELERSLRLYSGTFLPEDGGVPIFVGMRERLRAKFVRGVLELGKRFEVGTRHEDAIGWYLRGLETDPIIEAFYQGLMRCYVALDRRTEAIAAYHRLRRTLLETLQIRPCPKSEELYLALRTGGT